MAIRRLGGKRSYSIRIGLQESQWSEYSSTRIEPCVQIGVMTGVMECWIGKEAFQTACPVVGNKQGCQDQSCRVRQGAGNI